MIRSISISVCLLSVACALPAFAADAVKLKPLGGAYIDNKNVPLKNPEGIACNKSSIMVADTGNGRLVRYNLVNDELKDGTEIRTEKVSYPLRMRGTAKGEVLVLDGKTRKIHRVGADGSFVATLEPIGVPQPDEVVPRSMAVDAKDNVYLLDVLGERVLLLDPAGNYLRHIAFPKGYGFMSDVAVDQRGSVYVLDTLNAQVLKAAANETKFSVMATGLQEHLYFAVSIGIDSQGRVYILDQNDSGLVVLGPDGTFLGRYLAQGWSTGSLFYPAQACLTEDGNLIVADRNNSRVQIFKLQ